MYESFLYSLNSVAPIFVLVIIGFALYRAKVIDDDFIIVSDRLVFWVALPAMLFTEITEAAAGIGGKSGTQLTLFCLGGLFAVFIASLVIVPIAVKSNPQRGSMIQAAFRSNFAILGIPLAQNMFGDEGIKRLAIVLPFCIALFNALAVITFSLFAPAEKRLSPAASARKIILSIVQNPLIISIAAAIVISFIPLSLPVPVILPLKYLGNMTLPLSLISLGAGFRLADLRGGLKLALAATAVKLIAVPAVIVAGAIAMGFRGADLGIVLVLFGGPSAVSGYIMAKNMCGDYRLTGQITLMTTLGCVFTLFLSVFGLKLSGLI